VYWGAAGEQIDLLSRNLNFALPLIKAQSRERAERYFHAEQQLADVAAGFGRDVEASHGYRVRCDLNHKMAALNHNLAGNSAAAAKR
jgi:hypothetical protein